MEDLSSPLIPNGASLDIAIEACLRAIEALQRTRLLTLDKLPGSKITNDLVSSINRVLQLAVSLQGTFIKDGVRTEAEKLGTEDLAAICRDLTRLVHKILSEYKKPKRPWHSLYFNETLQQEKLKSEVLQVERRLLRLARERTLRSEMEISALLVESKNPNDVRDLLQYVERRPALKWPDIPATPLIPSLPALRDLKVELEEDGSVEVEWPAPTVSKPGDSSKQQILDWLSDPSADFKLAELAKERMPESGKWLPSLDHWDDLLSGDEIVLWCYGKPGSGKSMLMSSAVEKLKEEIEDSSEDVVIYYFLDYGSGSSALAVMSSLLRQLCERDVPLPNILTAKWRGWAQRYQNMLAGQETKLRMQLEDVVVSFFTVLSRFDRVIVCLDGLDACNDIQELTVVLQRLISSSPCRLFITSSRTAKLDRVLKKASRVNIEEYNQEDLSNYPAYFLHCNPDYCSIIDEFTPSRASRLLRCSDGRNHNYLGLILQLDELSKQINAYETAKLLDEFGRVSLAETYQIVLRRTGYQATARARLANRILTWMAHARRPLKFRELQQAVAIDPYRSDGQTYDAQSATDPKRVSSAKLMEEVCMGLLTIDCDQNTVAITPRSLTPYLRQFRNTLFPNGEEYVATCTISFLQHTRLGEPLKTETEYKALVEDLPFTAYISQHWGTHVRDYTPDVVRNILSGPLDALAQFLHIFHPRFASGIDKLAYPLRFSAVHFSVYFNLRSARNALWRENPDSWDRNALHIACLQSDADRVENYGLVENHDLEEDSSDDDEQEHELRPATNATADDGTKETIASNLALDSPRTRLKILNGLLQDARDSDGNQKDKDGRTPLHYATISGSEPMALSLIRHGVFVDVLDESLWTPLDYAAKGNHLGIARRLLFVEAVQTTKAPEAGDELPDHSDALRIAASRGHRDMVRLLLRHSASSGRDQALFEAAKAGFSDIVLLLHRRKATPSFRDAQGMTALHHVIVTRNLEIADYLITWDSNVNERDNLDRSPLLLAAEIGDLDILRQLVKRGAEIHVRDRYGQSPLDVAVKNGNSDVMELLLKYRDPGAILYGPKRTYTMDSEVSDKAGYGDAAEHAKDDEDDDDGDAEDDTGRGDNVGESTAAKEETKVKAELEKPDASETKEAPQRARLTALQFACSTTNNAAVVTVLLDAGIRPDSTGATLRTPLSYAAENGHDDIVKLLLATHRVNVNAADERGRTPLSYACGAGNATVVAAILDAGAVPDSPDAARRTPLSYAAESGHAEVVRRLLATGRVDANAADGQGRTALSYAAEHADVFFLLFKEDTGQASRPDRTGRTPMWYHKQAMDRRVKEMLDQSAKLGEEAK